MRGGKRERGWVSHVCTPSKTVSVTHYHQHIPTPSTLCPLLHSLFNSHINFTSFNRQPGLSSTECQSAVQGDKRVNEGEGSRGRHGGRRGENCLACSEAFFIWRSNPTWPAAFHFNCSLSLLFFLYYSHLFAWHLETFEDSRHLRLRHHDRDRQGGWQVHNCGQRSRVCTSQ